MWFETLPPDCPPNDATRPENQVLYRLVKYNPAQSCDFSSHKKLGLDTTLKSPPDPCNVCAISLFTSIEKAENLKKMRAHRGKYIAVVQLNRNAGVLKQTYQPEHYSWWRAKSYPIVDFTHVIE